MAVIGLGLFGMIGSFLFVSFMIEGKTPPSISTLFKHPRFIGGCVCLVLTLLCALALL